MARDSRSQQDANVAKGTPSYTPPSGQSDATGASTTQPARGEREQSIQTERERAAPSTVTRRPPTTSVFGTPFRASDSPFLLMRRMAQDMDRLFENFGFGGAGLGVSSLEPMVWSPQVETFRRGDQLVVRADLPGLRKEDVKVEVDDDMLIITGERRDENEERRDDYFRSERRYGQFYRAIPLPEGATGEQCNAAFKDGVLEVTLPIPKEEAKKAKQIPIR